MSNSDDNLRNRDGVCLRIDPDTSIEEDTNRVFVVGHKFIFSYFKKLVHYFYFGLRWNFCTTRSDRVITCNRTRRHGSKN